VTRQRRQAVVVIHGMGEQRPVETLNALSEVICRQAPFHSRPVKFRGDFEGRLHIVEARRDDEAADEHHGFDVQTDIYEYHWAHLMQGNRLDDLWPTFRRIMLPATTIPQLLSAVALLLVVVGAAGLLLFPQEWMPGWSPWVLAALGIAAMLAFFVTQLRRVPPGLWGLWLAIWLATFALAWGFVSIPGFSTWFGVPPWAQIAAGSVSALVIVTYAISRLLPGWLVKYLVDVVRYLDTSPRSFAARREIRAGIVDLLRSLQDSGDYDRIVVTGHSLGSYIAYDAISYLWATTRHGQASLTPEDLDDLEAAASALAADTTRSPEDYRRAQRKLWLAMRAKGHPWLISDFVSFGSPMNFADQIYTKDAAEFEERKRRRELPSCPPRSEKVDPRDQKWPLEYRPDANGHPEIFSYLTHDKRRRDDGSEYEWHTRRLHEAAAFAPVRWTNMWYPARLHFFGDWFGGGLRRLYGPGIADIALTGDAPKSRIPGYAHGVYVTTRDYSTDGAFATEFRRALDLESGAWLPWPRAQKPATPKPKSKPKPAPTGNGQALAPATADQN